MTILMVVVHRWIIVGDTFVVLSFVSVRSGWIVDAWKSDWWAHLVLKFLVLEIVAEGPSFVRCPIAEFRIVII